MPFKGSGKVIWHPTLLPDCTMHLGIPAALLCRLHICHLFLPLLLLLLLQQAILLQLLFLQQAILLLLLISR
jgi:hypothetical protein